MLQETSSTALPQYPVAAVQGLRRFQLYSSRTSPVQRLTGAVQDWILDHTVRNHTDEEVQERAVWD